MNKLMLSMALIIIACDKVENEPSTVDRSPLAREMEEAFKRHSVDVWYPLAVDTVYGGFLSDFNYRWQPDGKQDKMIVSQARHLWSCSKLMKFYPQEESYSSYARHGFKFLKEVMWDDEYGGFFNLVDRRGNVYKDEKGKVMKNAYGNAFGIYGLAAYYQVSQNEEVLDLAREAFQWLDLHSHDSIHQGYFQFLEQDGTPLIEGSGNVPPKDQNSSIHLLEAFTELYQVWPDEKLKSRLHEMMVLIRDTIATEQGYLDLFFLGDWTPVSYRDSSEAVRAQNFELDHVSFGHDVETAYLLLEASEVLGLENDSITLKKAKVMVDHSLDNGWDEQVGGIYDGGYYLPGTAEITILKDSKVWWAQAEAFNTFLMMADLFPEDERNYFNKFEMQWEYVRTYLLDEQYGGWYWGGLDKEPDGKTGDKGQIWKVNYHDARSMMNCIHRLRDQGSAHHGL